jgi:signal transduction histidine kinase
MAVTTMSGAVGLALFQLRALRFGVLGHALDLFVGLAFGTLGFANLLVRVLALADSTLPGQLDTILFLFLFARIVATLLFLAGLARVEQVIPAEARTWYGLRIAGGVMAVIVVGTASILLAGDQLLPSGVDDAARGQFVVGAVISGPQFEQETWLLFVRGSTCMLLLLAALGYASLSARSGDWDVASLAVALTLLFFSQLHTLVGGPVPVDYVSTADVFGLPAYAVLVYHLVARFTGDMAERASGAERLRLSRELHDGLAQQLSLLNLCLDRLAAPQRSPQQHAHDLHTARRLVEAAALEADQAITALRSGTVTWEAFVHAVATFAAEFAENHEVEVELATRSLGPMLDAELQAEVLRILHEACSNSIRHGAAKRIEVRLATSPGWLRMRVLDNGCGFDFDLALSSTGVGIRSLTERLHRRGGTLRFESTPGQGATLFVALPLARRRVLRR